jgi:hypothetical protein
MAVPLGRDRTAARRDGGTPGQRQDSCKKLHPNQTATDAGLRLQQ